MFVVKDKMNGCMRKVKSRTRARGPTEYNKKMEHCLESLIERSFARVFTFPDL